MKKRMRASMCGIRKARPVRARRANCKLRLKVSSHFVFESKGLGFRPAEPKNFWQGAAPFAFRLLGPGGCVGQHRTVCQKAPRGAAEKPLKFLKAKGLGHSRYANSLNVRKAFKERRVNFHGQ